ncbi:hypothetical protein [Bradyrhizobium cenepequi]|uniref:hypothetical protein n=1 Tax=Bradyrhizobium cenepequi TaxID=2821403 RepID=UPI001CE3B374|nr:hypothetical protein [Bradyrhizobium cenepequi]MCA6110253.1 hypothetical protein [Bradyrhizobium cenepequi]
MAQVAVCSFLFGAVFGLRFRVPVLLPLTLATGAIILLSVPVLSLTLLESLTCFAIGTLTLHGGYLFGSFTGFAISQVRATRVAVHPPTESGSCNRSRDAQMPHDPHMTNCVDDIGASNLIR